MQYDKLLVEDKRKLLTGPDDRSKQYDPHGEYLRCSSWYSKQGWPSKLPSPFSSVANCR